MTGEVITPLLTVLLVSAFIRIAVVLNILRFGIGLVGSGMGLVTTLAALVLSWVSSGPLLQQLGLPTPLALFASEATPLAAANQSKTIEQIVLPYLKKNVAPEMLERFSPTQDAQGADSQGELAEPRSKATIDNKEINVLLAAHVFGELKQAFLLGIMLLIPFLVIDLLVANVLTAVGLINLPQIAVAVPLKLLLFVAVDGWGLLVERFVAS